MTPTGTSSSSLSTGLTSEQEISLLQRYFPGSNGQSIAQTIFDELSAPAAGTPAATLQAAINNLATVSGAPVGTIDGIPIAPNATAVLNTGSYPTGTNTFETATNFVNDQANQSALIGGQANYYQIGNTEVGSAVNQFYANSSSSAVSQAVKDFTDCRIGTLG